MSASVLLRTRQVGRIDELNHLGFALELWKLLNRFLSMFVCVATGTHGVVRNLIRHFSICVGKPEVVLEKFYMTIHVGNHKFLICDVISIHSVCIGWIVVNHHLLNLLQAPLIPLRQRFVLHPKSPMTIPSRDPGVSSSLVEFIKFNQLKDCIRSIRTILPDAIDWPGNIR